MGSTSPLFACLRAPRPAPAVAGIAQSFSPRLQRHGPACVVCDVSGLGRLLGEPAAIGAELASAASAAGQAMSIAVAPTMTAGLLLTLAGSDLSIVTGDPAAAVAMLPLLHLQQLVAAAQGTTARRAASGGSKADAERKRYERAFDMARRWGLTSIGELAALPAGELSARMGQEGIRLHALAHARDAGPLVPDPDIPRFVERMELEWPIDTLEPLSFVLARMLEPLSAALARADRGAAAIRLTLRLADKTMHERVLQLPAAMRDARVLRTLLQLDLEAHPPAAAVDVVTIEADPAPGRVVQYSLLERAVPSVETIATLTARLGALVGEDRCGTAALLDTHKPDGFEMRRFDLAAGARPQKALSQDVTPPAASGDGTAGRPSSVLLPMLRRFRPPVAVRVTVERGRPVRIAIDRRGMPGGAVERCAGPWRTSGAWWDPARWDRDEWDVALRDGTLCRLYRQRDAGTWFLEGVLD
jgi:protein ImuB